MNIRLFNTHKIELKRKNIQKAIGKNRLHLQYIFIKL